jgi:hypothetical protein
MGRRLLGAGALWIGSQDHGLARGVREDPEDFLRREAGAAADSGRGDDAIEALGRSKTVTPEEREEEVDEHGERDREPECVSRRHQTRARR